MMNRHAIALSVSAVFFFSCAKYSVSDDSDVATLCQMTLGNASPSFCDCPDGNCYSKPEFVDLCPANDEKTSPGVCGCDSPDVDENHNGLIDCIEEEADLCPDDPEKIIPGCCGCGIPDTDSDGDTVIDCLEHCPNDPNKVFEGICGCNTPDTSENLEDDDEDGVINCLDACPTNPHKTRAMQSGCDVNDSDGDGYDDGIDACPTNPNVWYNPEAPNANIAELCFIDDSRNFHVFHPSDLKYLVGAKDLNHIVLENDMNLNDMEATPLTHTDNCQTIAHSLYDLPVYLDGNHKTIQYRQSDGTRCKLDKPLFHTLKGATDLTLDIDFEGTMSAGIALYGYGIFTNVTYSGHFENTAPATDIPANAGGLFLELHDCALNNVICDKAEFEIGYVRFGAIAHTITQCSMNYTKPNHISKLESNNPIAQIAGYAYSGDRFSNIIHHIDHLSGNGAGFAVVGEQFDHIHNYIQTVKNATGFVQLLSSNSKNIQITHITNEIHDYEGPAPFIDLLYHKYDQTTISNITNTIDSIKATTTTIGSFISRLQLQHASSCPQVPLLTINYIQNSIHNMSFPYVINKAKDGNIGGFIGSITHCQPSFRYILEQCQNTTPPAVIDISHIISQIDTLNLMNFGSGFIGTLELQFLPISSYDLIDHIPNQLLPTLNMKNVLSVANIISPHPDTSHIGTVVGQYIDNADNTFIDGESLPEFFEQTHHQFPEWHAMTIQAFVSAGQFLSNNNKDLSHNVFGNTFLNDISKRNGHYIAEDSYYYNYTNEAQPNTAFASMASPIQPSSAYALKLITFLQHHSPLWEYQNISSRDTKLVLPILEL